MKKIIALVLALTFCTSLAACGTTDRAEPYLAAVIRPIDETAPDDQKIELIMAVNNVSPELQNLVIDFNKQSEDYKIRMILYSNSRISSKLFTEDAPDIYAFDQSSILEDHNSAPYFPLFEDLLPYLDTDPDYSRDTLLPSILNATLREDKLYSLPYNFSISTFIAPKSVVGDVQGLTMEEALDFAAEIGDETHVFPEWLVKEEIFKYVLSYTLETFIDTETNTSSFNSPEFIELLEACNRQHLVLPEGFSLFPTGDELLSLSWFFGAQAFRNHIEGLEDYAYIGIPSNINSTGSLYCEIQFQMSSQSEHKDAVWSFLRTTMDAESSVKMQSYFSATQAGLTAQLQHQLEKSESITQEDIDEFVNFVSGIELVQTTPNHELRLLILEIANTYFSGETSAKTAATFIEKNVNIYLSEQNS